jgi:hypothetical protein
LQLACEAGGPPGYAAAGGSWLCRMRPWGLVAVVVPSGLRVMVQPHRWMGMRWWKGQPATLPELWHGKHGHHLRLVPAHTGLQQRFGDAGDRLADRIADHLSCQHVVRGRIAVDDHQVGTRFGGDGA